MARQTIGTLVMDLVSNDAEFRKGLTKALAHAERSLKRTGAKMTRLGGKMSAGITAPIAGIAIASTKMASDFDASMREVNSLLNLSAQGFQDLKSDVLGLSVALGTDLNETVKASYQAISAGIPRENLISFLEVASKASIAGVASVESAVTVLTKTMDSYGKETVTAEELSDMLFATVKNGVTTFEELASALPNVSGLAAALSVSQAELLGILTRTTKVSGTTSDAVTRIASAMGALIKTNTAMDSLLEKAEIKNVAADIKKSGLLPLLLKLQKTAAPGQLEQAFGRKEAILLLKDLKLNQDAWEQSIKATNNALGATQEAFDIVDEGTGRGAAKLAAAWKGFAITLGDQLLPILLPLIDGLTQAAMQLQTMDPALLQVGIQIAAVAAVLGPLVLGVGMFITALGTLAGVVGAVAGAISLPLIAAIAAIIAAGALVVKHWEQVKMFFIGAVDAIKSAFVRWRTENAGTIAAVIATFTKFKDTLARIWTASIERISEFSSFVAEKLNALLEPIGGLQGAWEVLKVAMWSAIEFLTKSFGNFFALVTNQLSVFADLIEGKINVFEALKIGWGNSIEFLKQMVKDLVDSVKDTFASIDWEKVGLDLMKGLALGIAKGATIPHRAALKAAGNIVQGVKDVFKERSPSKVFEEIGLNLMRGLKIGIDSGANDAIGGINAMHSPINSFADRMTDLLTGAGNQWQSFGGVVKSVLADMAHNMVRSGIGNLLGGALGALGSFGGGATNRASFGILGGLRSILGFAEGGRPPVGRVSVVGESGPELFVPDRAGTIVPNHQLGGGRSSGPQVMVTQNFSSGIDEARLSGAAKEIEERTTRGILDAIRRGGNFRQIVQA